VRFPDLSDLPRAHLHLHLEGAARPTTLLELADRDGRESPDLDGYDGLPGFVRAYETARDLIANLEDLARVGREVAEDALAQGFVWLEVHVSPQAYGGRIGPAPAVLEAVLAGLLAPQQAHTGVGVLLGMGRAQGPTDSEVVVDLADRFAGEGVVGLGLVGDERHAGAPFADHFARARAAGLLSVPHAGETRGAGRVREALDMLRADRIGHGVTAVEDLALLERLRDEQVCLDVCPTSNVRLGVAPDWQRHPVHQLVAAGVPVSLNSDDPTFFGASGLDEYRAAARLGLPVARLAADSLRHSAAPAHVRRPALAAVARWEAEHAVSTEA